MKGSSVNNLMRHHGARRGFTLVEVVLAAVITAFVLGSLTVSLGSLSRAKDSSKTRLDAHLRADAALNMMRRDVASVVRHEDLFWVKLVIRSSSVPSPLGDLDRDEIMVFNTRLRLMQDIDFNGEGMQYETQYRIAEHEGAPMLWQRRDPVPDQYPLAGGIATPMVEGLLALRIEAYDGYQWFRTWDSDDHGLPLAIRITLMASGHRNGEDLYTAPTAILRTVVPIDRVLPPADNFRPDEDEEEEELEDVSDPEAEALNQMQQQPGGVGNRPGAGPGGRPGDGTGGRPGDGGRPGAGDGGRPGGGGGAGGRPGGRPSANPNAGGGGGGNSGVPQQRPGGRPGRPQ